MHSQVNHFSTSRKSTTHQIQPSRQNTFGGKERRKERGGRIESWKLAFYAQSTMAVISGWERREWGEGGLGRMRRGSEGGRRGSKYLFLWSPVNLVIHNNTAGQSDGWGSPCICNCTSCKPQRQKCERETLSEACIAKLWPTPRFTNRRCHYPVWYTL